jgi:hypothetical protein
VAPLRKSLLAVPTSQLAGLAQCTTDPGSCVHFLRVGFVMRHSELEFFHDAALLLILGSMCSTVYVLGFFLAGLMIFGPEQTRRTAWPGGHVMGVMLTTDGGIGSAERGGATDWRRVSDSEVRPGHHRA